MKEFLENYTLIKIIDSCDYKLYRIIALNNKHNLADFKNEWERVKNMLYEERQNETYEDDDLSYIIEHISNDFDWELLDIDDFSIEI